jgi:hypothetical protein
MAKGDSVLDFLYQYRTDLQGAIPSQKRRKRYRRKIGGGGGGVSLTITYAIGQASLTNASPINFKAVFSEPVSGFGNPDIAFTFSTVGGVLAAAVTGGPTVYNIAVTGMTGAGNVVVNTLLGAATTIATSLPSPAAVSPIVQYDAVAPSVTINKAAGQSDPTTDSTINFTVVFSEIVTGFTSADVSLATSTVGGSLGIVVTGSGTTYNVAVTGMMAPDGDVIATVPANGAADAAGNLNTISTSTDNIVAWTGVSALGLLDRAGNALLDRAGAALNSRV